MLACSREASDGSAPAGGRAAGAAERRPGAPSQPAIPVAVAPAVTGSIASYYTATATLGPEKEAEILARVSGVAKRLGCEEGDRVKEGSDLLVIDNDEYRLRLAQAEANTANLAARHERMKGMLAKNLVSAEEFEALKNELKRAEADEGLSRLDLSYTRVTAPFTGHVVSRLVDVGQNISVGTPLFVLADFEPLLARVHVPSKEFKRLKPDQTVQLVLDSSRARLEGRIKLVSPVIDPASGTIKVTVEVPEYPPETRPGDFAEVRIMTERRTDTTLVPRIAVVTDRGDQVVYAVAPDSTAERRVVEVGFEDDEQIEILAGVEPGDEVVVKGQRSLKNGVPIKILDDRIERLSDTDPAAEQGQGAGRRPRGGRGGR
jgi:membrane fusion protein (multidrug efflux system)